MVFQAVELHETIFFNHPYPTQLKVTPLTSFVFTFATFTATIVYRESSISSISRH
jgi:hypothetical protein